MPCSFVPDLAAIARLGPVSSSLCLLFGRPFFQGARVIAEWIVFNGLTGDIGQSDVLARIADTPVSRLEQLLPWSWAPKTLNAQAA